MKMPMLCSPGKTLTEVPVNLAVIWSKPRAVMPFSGQATWKALTGGWCEVCSVRYETVTGFSAAALPCCGTDSDTVDAVFSLLEPDFKLEVGLLEEPRFWAR